MQLIMGLLDSIETADVSKTQATTPDIYKAWRKACKLQSVKLGQLKAWSLIYPRVSMYTTKALPDSL